LVEHVQEGLSGDVSYVGGALHRGAPERPQVQFALLVAVKGDAEVLQVHHLAGRFRAHDFDRVLVAEVVRALDGVVRVRVPVVIDRDRRVYASRGGHRVRAHRVDLADDGHAGARPRGRQSRALAGQTGSDDQHVVFWHLGEGDGDGGRCAGTL